MRDERPRSLHLSMTDTCRLTPNADCLVAHPHASQPT